MAFFSFLFHGSGGIRKGGSLTKKAQERALALLPASLGPESERLAALLRAFDAAGFLGSDGEAREPDLAAFSSALKAWGEALPAYLAAALALGPEADGGDLLEGPRRVVEAAAASAAALAASPQGFVFSKGGLSRWLEIALRRARRREDGEAAAQRRDLVEALLSLGLVSEAEGGLVVSAPWRQAEATEGPEAASEEEAKTGRLLAEGSHALHLLPEAGLEERLLVGVVARPLSFETVWTFEVDRESARASFAAGLGADDSIARLTKLAGRSLPQSLSFSLKAWEEEYRSLRLYRGFVLVADERLRLVVERSKALAPRIAEILAPGVYVLAVSGPEEAAELIEEAGLEVPPETHYGHAKRPTTLQLGAARAFEGPGSSPYIGPGLAGLPSSAAPKPHNTGQEELPLEEGQSYADSLRAKVHARAAAAVAPLAALSPRPPTLLDPRPRISLLEAALEMVASGLGAEAVESIELGRPAASSETAARARADAAAPPRSPAELRELADRIERRLILTPRQLIFAEVRPERLEAVGLDYLGKVRIVERSLRSPGDRLELLYRLPGAEPTRVLVRPVRLEKTEKGLVLEAEDLGNGNPVRVSLGAVSSVRRMRASLFGDDS